MWIHSEASNAAHALPEQTGPQPPAVLLSGGPDPRNHGPAWCHNPSYAFPRSTGVPLNAYHVPGLVLGVD